MPNALTVTQLEILRRLQERRPLSSEPRINDVLGELALLGMLHLIRACSPGAFMLTELGIAYLSAAQGESAIFLERRIYGAPELSTMYRPPAANHGREFERD